MKTWRINTLPQAVILSGVLLAAVPNTWASSAGLCTVGNGGTGMGGTGIVARGTGMGGTGIEPGKASGAMQLAGRVMFSNGRIEALSGGRSRQLAKGDPVCVGETILSAKAASAQIRMIDDELIAVRPETRIRIDNYAFHGKSDDNIMLSLLEGACRIVSGEIGKRVPQNDLVRTEIAIIGIRGTDHELAIVPSGRYAAYPAGVYDKVNKGVTFIRTEKGTIDIHPNQVGFAASQLELPRLLTSMPAFYNNLSVPLSSGGNASRHEQAERGRPGADYPFERPETSPEWEGRTGSGAMSSEPVQTTAPALQPGAEPQSESSPLPAPLPSPGEVEHTDMTAPTTTVTAPER